MNRRTASGGRAWVWCLVFLIWIPAGAGLAAAASAERVSASQPASSATEPASQPAGGVLEFRVVHRETREPMKGVELTISIGEDKSWCVTEATGLCRIELSRPDPEYVTISAFKTGFVPTKVSWHRREGQEIPSSYTLAMEVGTSIGGLIQDEEGRPIAGATVYLLVPGRDGEIERPAIWDHAVLTDADGRWECDIMPARLDDVLIRLEHEDYVSDNTYGATQKPSMEQLRAKTGVMVMKSGFAVAGIVLGPAGQPVSGASVVQGSDRWGSHYPDTETDGDGRFTFANAEPGRMVLTVQADGYGPDLKEVTVEQGLRPVEFRLEPGRTIRGRVTDTSGEPLAGVTVSADTWRGHRSITWRTKTDEQGRFTWTEAPGDVVLCDIFKKGYMDARNHALQAGEQEQVVVLHAPLRISGGVTDAQTGEPIARFKVISGIQWANDRPAHWDRRNPVSGGAGRYEITFTYPYPGHLIRIEAEGYKPAVSRAFQNDEGEQVWDVKLEPGGGLAGVVQLAEGGPAAGATVALATAAHTVRVNNGRIENRDTVWAETDADGRFTLPDPLEPYLVVAVHERGWAKIAGEQSIQLPTVTLQPWSRIEGTLRIGSKPGANERVSIWYREPFEPNKPRVSWDYDVPTDSQGRFVFEHVVPGEAGVSRYVQLGPDTWGGAISKQLTVTAGQTSEVELGGQGRPIVGRVVLPAGVVRQTDWGRSFCHLLPGPSFSPGTRPANWVEALFVGLQQSQKAKAAAKAREEQPSYSLSIASDGSFRIEDVEAGSYELRISIYEPQVGRQCGFGDEIGSATREISVPAMPGGRSDEPMDIGAVELQARHRLTPGQEAPPFEIRTLDDQPLRLADFRGKHVLLEFWATWCGPCVEELTHLKDVFESYKEEDRLVIVGLSLDSRSKTARDFVAKKGLQWPQGFLGDWSKTKLPEQYGVLGIPAVFLIGPDGKIVEKNLRGGEIKAAVARALGGPAASRPASQSAGGAGPKETAASAAR